MNTTAVFVGLFYGILSVVLCYVVSMLTSGLFTRPFYRLYSGVLIGICSLMLLAPVLRGLALSGPQLAVLALTLAQYGVIGVLGYGVYRFNREYLKRLFLERSTAAYFTFGTLANAAVVTIAFLHVAISGTPGWHQSSPGYLTANNYGPIFVLLAAMVFHTDYHLKRSLGTLRRFSRFTFVGYAISFVGLGLSLVPYVGKAFGKINLVAIDSPLLQNFFSAQAVLIAIVLYAWLVWRYESIPPLFLLLLAIIGEYHILVSQWVIGSWGVESWGLASLPLFAGLIGLDHYFAYWDQRKRSRSGDADAESGGDADGEAEATDTLRFAMPFRWVGTMLAVALFAITLWARFISTGPVSPTWLGATFIIYAFFFVALALFRREPRLIYASGLLAGLAVLLGTSVVGGELATSLLALIAAAFSATAVWGGRVGLKLSWKTPLTDCALLGAIVVTLLVLGRQLPADGRFYLQVASPLDAIALAIAAFAYLATAHQYRSRLPVYGALIALAMIIPPWSAAVGLAATVAAAWIERRYGIGRQGNAEEPVPLLGIARLTAEDTLPSLYVGPLSFGAIPLALIGLLTSAISIFQRDFTLTALVGAAISALVLGLLTARYRQPSLYLTSLFATYFAVHSIAHATLFQNWPFGNGMPAHLLLAAGLSLLGGMIAVVYSALCAAMLRRVAEAKEPALRANRAYYAGWLLHAVSGVAAVTLVLVMLTWVNETSEPLLLLLAAALISLLFAGAAAVYRTQVGSYVSLSALTLALLIAGDAFDLPRWGGAVIAAAGLCAAALSWLTLRGSQPRRESGSAEPDYWLGPIAVLPARGLALWREPLMVYAMICTVPAVLASMRFSSEGVAGFQLSSATPFNNLLAGITLLLSTRIFRQSLVYVIGIGLGFAAAHAATALWLGQRDMETLAPWVHIVVAAGTSLVCGGAGALIAIAFNRTARRGDEELRNTLVMNRDFYAAPLVHIAFAASLLVLVVLAFAMIAEGLDTPGVALLIAAGGLMMAVTFGLSAVIYQSRISTYCVLFAGGLAAHAVVAMLAPVSLRLEYQTLVIAATAVVLGGVSYWIARWEPRDVADLAAEGGGEGAIGTANRQSPRLLQCCQGAALPLVSRDVSLWSLPLAHGSVVLALLGLLFVGYAWPEHHGLPVPTWLKVLPIYLTAIALLIATTTHRTGWLQFGIYLKNLQPWQRRLRGEWAERGVLYVLSLLSLGTAIHITVQRTALDALPQRLGLSWHLFVAAVLVMIGWSVATLLSLRLRNRRQRFAAYTKPEPAVLAADSDITVQGESPLAAGAADSLYAGLLHHVCLAAAIGLFGVAGILTVASLGQAGPLLGLIGLLVLYFGLAADSYRSQLGSYLSVLSIGLAALQISAIATVSWPWLGSLAAPAIAMLGLALMVAATWLAKHHPTSPSGESGEVKERFYFAAPWPRSPLPLGVSSPLLIWLAPLRQMSLLLAMVSLAVVSGGVFGFVDQVQAAPVLTTCLLVVATFALGARLENAPLLTYFAAIVLAFGSVALLATLGQPIGLLGVALAVLALALWIAGFGVERWQRRRSGSTAELLPAAVIRIYEQPLIRCSAVLAGIAIGHSLLVWFRDGWLESFAPLVIASALGAVTLMLNARSLAVLERGVWARVMVYFACLSFAGCWLASSTMIWPAPAGLGPNAVLVALLLGGVGLWLVEKGRRLASKHPDIAASRLTFGEPLSHFAAGLAIVAASLATVALGLSQQLRQVEGSFARIDLALLLSVSITYLVASIVCLMSVRVQQRIGWLYAGIVLASSGLLMLMQSQLVWTPSTLAVGTLILMNLLVLSARWVRANQNRVGDFLGLRDASCERPFYEWPLVCTAGLLVGQCVYLGVMCLRILTPGGDALGVAPGGDTWPWFWVNLLSGMIFFQIFCLHLKAVYVHLLVVSSVICLAGIGLSSDWAITPDVAIALLGVIWGVVAAVIDRPIGARIIGLLRLPLESDQREQGERLLFGWASGLVALALAIAVPVSLLLTNSLWNLMVVLAIVTLAALGGGLRWRNVSATTLAAVLLPASLTCAIFVFGYQYNLSVYGHLLTAILAAVYLGVGYWVEQRRMRGDEYAKPFLTGVSRSLNRIAQLLTGGVALMVVLSIMQGNPALPTVMSLGLISALWVWIAWDCGKELFAYASIAGFFATVVYASDAMLQIRVTDNSVAAFIVIASSFLLYSINLLVSRTDDSGVSVFLRPTYYAALALPIALIAAIPFDQPVVAAFALLAAGSFYMTVSQQSRTRWTLYVAAALVNFAVYLWLPAASALTGLYQLYVIPAAVTVLIFVQLHRNDLKPPVLTALRLAASGCILAVSTSEVFFTKEPSIVQFILVLMLSLAGITLGISLRIKPFIYVGLSFLVVNVVGQLGLQFHREAGVMRAIILIGVGLVVLAMMIFFNIHRERILNRYRRFSVDETWE